MDLRQIKDLIKTFGQSSLSKIKIEDKDFNLTLEKTITSTTSALGVVKAPVPSTTNTSLISAEAPAAATEKFLSPMVGTYYKAASPGAEPFVKKGDIVRKGQVICFLEAMKIMNEVEAEFDFKILDILVGDGQPVDFEAPIFSIERV